MSNLIHIGPFIYSTKKSREKCNSDNSIRFDLFLSDWSIQLNSRWLVKLHLRFSILGRHFLWLSPFRFHYQPLWNIKKIYIYINMISHNKDDLNLHIGLLLGDNPFPIYHSGWSGSSLNGWIAGTGCTHTECCGREKFTASESIVRAEKIAHHRSTHTKPKRWHKRASQRVLRAWRTARVTRRSCIATIVTSPCYLKKKSRKLKSLLGLT